MCGEIYVFKFRPSSHSEDITLIAECGNKGDAKKMCSELRKFVEEYLEESETDWEYPKISILGNRVLFTVHTNSEETLDDIRSFMEYDAQTLDVHRGYQEIEVSVRIPKNARLGSLALISPEEAKILKKLEQHCGPPKVQKKKRFDVLDFCYKGDYIFDCWAENGSLVFGDEEFQLPENWKVVVTRDEGDRWYDSLPEQDKERLKRFYRKNKAESPPLQWWDE